MYEIDSFEFLDHTERSRFLKEGDPALPPIPEKAPPRKGLRDFCGSDPGNRKSFEKLLHYLGAEISHLCIKGEVLELQYKCGEGYLLFSRDKNSDSWPFYQIGDNEYYYFYVTYLLEGFLGLEWYGIEVRVPEGMHLADNPPCDESEVVGWMTPYRNIELSDPDTISFTLPISARYTATVHVPPKRFVDTFTWCWNFGYHGPENWRPRHLHLRRGRL